MDSNLSCFTYENVLATEDVWGGKGTIWVMGKCFRLPEEKVIFLECVRSCIWFTYRRGFDPIGGTGPTSDSGWGCMLRCGQMMLSQALIKMKLNATWKWRPNEMQISKYYKILQCFADNKTSCYSVHQIAQMGAQDGKNVGEWFGPNTIAQALKKLSAFDEKNGIAIHVAMDNTVHKEEVEALCRARDNPLHLETSPDGWKPLVLIIPLRLGLSDINPVYFENLKSCFKWEQNIGIIGGKPNHAYYFIGFAESDSLVFLDPHTTQQAAIWSKSKLDVIHDQSYHCDNPSKMAMSQLDPSLAIGFYCQDHDSFENLCKKIHDQSLANKHYALFTVFSSLSSSSVVSSRVMSVSVHNKNQIRSGSEAIDDNSCLTLDSDEDVSDVDEEFEILDVT